MTSPGKAAAEANQSIPVPPPNARFHPLATPPFKVPPATPVLATAKANQSVLIPPANAFADPLATIPFKVPPAIPPLAFKAHPATLPAFIPVPVPPKLRQLWSWPFHREAEQRFEQRINELGGAPPPYFKAPPPWALQNVPPPGYRRAHVFASLLERPRPDRRRSV